MNHVSLAPSQVPAIRSPRLCVLSCLPQWTALLVQIPSSSHIQVAYKYFDPRKSQCTMAHKRTLLPASLLQLEVSTRSITLPPPTWHQQHQPANL